VTRAVVAHVVRVEPLGHGKINLHGAALPLATNRVFERVLNLGTVKRTVTRGDFKFTTRSAQTLHQRVFGFVPTFIRANPRLGAGGDFVNDVFKAFGMEINDFELIIYNRWGEKIFQTQDINLGWDGTYKGTVSPLGTYVWELEASDKYGKPLIKDIQRRGVVNLIR
jgi:gliding motility-associated-like protein